MSVFGYAFGYKGVLCYNRLNKGLFVFRYVIHDEQVFPFHNKGPMVGSAQGITVSNRYHPIIVPYVLPISTEISTSTSTATSSHDDSMSNRGSISRDSSEFQGQFNNALVDSVSGEICSGSLQHHSRVQIQDSLLISSDPI